MTEISGFVAVRALEIRDHTRAERIELITEVFPGAYIVVLVIRTLSHAVWSLCRLVVQIKLGFSCVWVFVRIAQRAGLK